MEGSQDCGEKKNVIVCKFPKTGQLWKKSKTLVNVLKLIIPGCMLADYGVAESRMF